MKIHTVSESACDGNRTKNDLAVLAEIIKRFDLKSLVPVIRACEELARNDSFLDVAVLGQFKCGKSSLLNAILKKDICPVGALPATAVVTRARFGPSVSVSVTHVDGSIENVQFERIAEFVTEAGNPNNRRQVAVVDVLTPQLQDWPAIRLVDTPGLGSIHLHNTGTTNDWLPNVAVAMIVVSAERPLADEDRRLLDEARQFAGRVVVVLSKIDLLSAADQADVLAFLERTIRDSYGQAIPVLQFSTRVECERWVDRLNDTVFRPLVTDIAEERRRILDHKKAHLVGGCRGYLEVGLQAAERSDADREQLRKAVLNETVTAAVIQDELILTEQRVAGSVRPTFEKLFLSHESALCGQLRDALGADLPTWTGNLAQQTNRFEQWISDQMMSALSQMSDDSFLQADPLLGEAEKRFRRIVEAFRDRLNRNIRDAMGIAISPVSWQVAPVTIASIPIRIGRTFMTPWEMLWWLLPMPLMGWLFRRHVRGLIPWEVNKNLTRLAIDWSDSVKTAITELRSQAFAWVEAELATLDRMLGKGTEQAAAFRDALRRLDECGEATRECGVESQVGQPFTNAEQS